MEKTQYIFLFKFLCLLYDKMKTYICLSVSLGSWKTWLTLAGLNQNVTDQHCDNMWGKWLLLLIQVVWVLMKVSFQPKWVFSQWKIHFFFFQQMFHANLFAPLWDYWNTNYNNEDMNWDFLWWVMSNVKCIQTGLWSVRRSQKAIYCRLGCYI